MGKMRQTVMAAATALALAGCNEARAENNNDKPVETAEAVSMTLSKAEISLNQAKTQGECFMLGNQIKATTEQIQTCMVNVTARDSATRQAGIAEKQAILAEKDETITTNEEANEKRRTTVEVLTVVRDVSREAVEAGTDNPTQ